MQQQCLSFIVRCFHTLTLSSTRGKRAASSNSKAGRVALESYIAVVEAKLAHDVICRHAVDEWSASSIASEGQLDALIAEGTSAHRSRKFFLPNFLPNAAYKKKASVEAGLSL